jgi:N utilization substance protein A
VRVDIRSETQVAEGVPSGYGEDVEYAEGEWVANPETGEMEWHAADGSVMSQAEWAGDGAATEAVAEEAATEDAATEDAATEDAATEEAATEDAATEDAADEPADAEAEGDGTAE